MSNLQLRKVDRNNFINAKNECKPIKNFYNIHWRGFVISDKSNKVLRNGKTTSGYFTVALNGRSFYLHRLVSEAFIPNPDNKPCVNHKDGNKSNNHVSNLEWCTYSENMIHASKNGLQVPISGETCPHAKKVINIKTGEIYHSIADAARTIKKSRSHTQLMLIGKRTNTSNLKFYKND